MKKLLTTTLAIVSALALSACKGRAQVQEDVFPEMRRLPYMISEGFATHPEGRRSRTFDDLFRGEIRMVDDKYDGKLLARDPEERDKDGYIDRVYFTPQIDGRVNRANEREIDMSKLSDVQKRYLTMKFLGPAIPEPKTKEEAEKRGIDWIEDDELYTKVRETKDGLKIYKSNYRQVELRLQRRDETELGIPVKEHKEE